MDKGMRDSITLEACVGSTASALEAARGGADRVELCDNLHDGGTTPGPGSIIAARERLTIGLHVIIRPRGGDFIYSDLDFQIMKSEIAFCRDHKVDGVVLGVLTPDGGVDQTRTAELAQLARPMTVTFHRAFDVAIDPQIALRQLIDLGIDRILTSGQRRSALEGADLIAQLIHEASSQIVVMPGGGIKTGNIAEVVRRTGADEFHVCAEVPIDSAMEFRNESVSMGPDANQSEYQILLTDVEQIAQLREKATAAR